MSPAVNTISRLAENTFRDHEIREVETVLSSFESDVLLMRMYVFKRPKTGSYAFTVTLIPGWIFVQGDIGFLAISRERDMIPWCRSTMSHEPERIDWRYIASKCPREMRTREWTEESATQAMDAMLKNAEIDYEDRLQLYDNINTMGEDGWRMSLLELHQKHHLDVHDLDCPLDWTSAFVWQVLGLRAFIQKLDSTTEASKSETSSPLPLNPYA